MWLTREKVEIARYYLTLLMWAGAIFGLVISPPVLSIALISLVVLGLLDPLRGINPRWWANARKTFRSSFFWGMAGLYLLLLLGLWQTEDWTYYAERIRVKVPLLSLPFVWVGLPDFGKKEYGWIRAGAVLFFSVLMLLVLGNYLLNFAEINDMIRRGQAMPVPRNHIRFSLMVAAATLLAVANYRQHTLGWGRAWLLLAAFLFIGQHFLAVRSGLAGAYGALAVLIAGVALERRKWQWLIAGLIGLCLLPTLAYVAVPSFRTKMNYVRYELLHRNPAEDTGEYSDSGRLTSIRIGLEIWRDHPVFGVGPGNLLAETDARYAEVLPGVKGKRPHNQFVSALAGSGTFGGIITVACFLLLGLGNRRWRDPIYLAVFTVLLLSCMVENTLETSAGVSMFCLLLLLTRPDYPTTGKNPQ
jgi:O-antigen ligase